MNQTTSIYPHISTQAQIFPNIYYTYTSDPIDNKLSNLSFNIYFEFDKDEILSNNIFKIKKSNFFFNCDYIKNRIQPYEYIMKLIENKTKMSVKIEVSDILTISYINLMFTEIENNLTFFEKCDFSKLKVNFKCDKILYNNHKLSTSELRTDKLKKILNNNE